MSNRYFEKTGVYDPSKPRPGELFQLKFDGHWTCLKRDKDGKVTVTTRIGTDITEKLKWHPAVARAATALPPGTVLLGELWLPGATSSGIKTAINDKHEDLSFTPFAIARCAPIPLQELEHWSLWRVNNQLRMWGYSVINPTEKPPFGFQNELPRDIEGYVVKLSNLLGWQKWKPVKTIDLIVCGVTQGQGKYEGKVGALRVRTSEGHEVAQISGMTDEQRNYFTAISPIGRVVEVQYQEVGSKGRLRFPQFIRTRDDKARSECGLDQDKALRSYYES